MTFTFDGSTPLVSVTANALQPRSPTRYQGVGKMQFDDGSVMELDSVRAELKNQRIKYSVSGRSGSIQATATIETDGCLGSIRKVDVRVKPGKKVPPIIIKDAALVGIGAIVTNGVLALDEDTVDGIIGYGPVLIVPVGHPLLGAITPGVVVLATSTETTPGGFLGTVSSSTGRSDDYEIFLTTEAPLSAAFDRIDIALGNGDDAAGTVGGRAASTQPSVRVRFDNQFGALAGGLRASAMSGSSIIPPEDRTISASYTFAGGVTVDGTASFSADPSLELDCTKIDPPGPGSVQFCTKATLKVDGRIEARATARAVAAFDIEQSTTIASKTLKDIKIGWVVVTPVLSLVAGVDGHFSQAITVGGRAWTDGGVEVSCGLDVPPCDSKLNAPDLDAERLPTTIAGNGNVRVEIGPKLELLVYRGLGKVFLTSTGFLEATGDTSQYPRWHVFAGIGLEIGAKFTILEGSKRFTPIRKEIAWDEDAPPPPPATSVEIWCGHLSPMAPYGDLRRCYWLNHGGPNAGLNLVFDSLSTPGTWDGHLLGNMVALEPLSAVHTGRVHICGEDPNVKFDFIGGPKIDAGGYGHVSYGELRWNVHPYGTILRWGQYSFHPSNNCFTGENWRDDVSY